MKIHKVEPNGDVIEDTVCNKCGKSLRVKISSDGDYHIIGLEEIHYNGYYGSIYDLERRVFSICEPCLTELFESFVIKPEVWDYSSGKMIERMEEDESDG